MAVPAASPPARGLHGPYQGCLHCPPQRQLSQPHSSNLCSAPFLCIRSPGFKCSRVCTVSLDLSQTPVARTTPCLSPVPWSRGEASLSWCTKPSLAPHPSSGVGWGLVGGDAWAGRAFSPAAFGSFLEHIGLVASYHDREVVSEALSPARLVSKAKREMG